MAMAEIIKTKAGQNFHGEVQAVATLTADGGYVDYNADDQTLVLLIGGAAATIKAGNGLQGVSDLLIPFATGKTQAVTLESGHFVNVSGVNKGKVIITGTGATVQAIQLP